MEYVDERHRHRFEVETKTNFKVFLSVRTKLLTLPVHIFNLSGFHFLCPDPEIF